MTPSSAQGNDSGANAPPQVSDEELGSFDFIISEPMKSGGKIGHHWVYNVTWKVRVPLFLPATWTHETTDTDIDLSFFAFILRLLCPITSL